MSKLLNKPFKAFTIYALIVLASSIPIYYLTVTHIWMDELDEHNSIIKRHVEQSFKNKTIHEEELYQLIEHWNIIQPGTQLTPSTETGKIKDDVYTVTKLLEDEEERYRGLSSQILINDSYYTLNIETNVEEVDETFFAIALVTFLFFTLLIVGFIILNRIIAKTIWKPFSHTLSNLKEFDLAKGNHLQFKKTDIEEFEELNQELIKLIDKNIAVYNQQKMFIENASHELQTPLAILKSKLELFLQNKDLTQHQSDIIDSIAIPLSRVTRINKNLLLLAKIDNHQFSDTESIDISKVINETAHLLSDYSEAKKISVATSLNPIQITTNKTLAEILITNLLINAIVHNSENGRLIIESSGKTLKIINTGFEKLNSDTIFERFVVATNKNTSSGLGLAISKEICNRYGWKLEYLFENNLHYFSVYF